MPEQKLVQDAAIIDLPFRTWVFVVAHHSCPFLCLSPIVELMCISLVSEQFLLRKIEHRDSFPPDVTLQSWIY